METLYAPPETELGHLDLMARIDELTTLLDGMTDGYLSKRLEKIYGENPERERLWSYFSPDAEAVKKG